MAPTIVLLASFVVLRFIGFLAVGGLDNWHWPLRIALCLMFLLTASAHWGARRADLIRMVPATFPSAPLLVTITGLLEIFGAIGLLLPSVYRVAAACLALLLVAIFPANIRAARERLTILGQPVPGLPVRTAMQVLFIASLIAVALR